MSGAVQLMKSGADSILISWGEDKKMAGAHFLRTVTYGGYDKADVLRRIDSLNEELFGLKNELRETKLLLESSKEGRDIRESIETVLAEERAKLTEAQVYSEELAVKLETAEDENKKYEEEIKKLKASLEAADSKLTEVNTQLAAAKADDEAAALSSVFIEAKKSANMLEDAAKEKAEEIESSAAAAAERAVAYANDESKMIIYEAECKAAEIIANAKNVAESQKRTALYSARESVLTKLSELGGQLGELKAALDSFKESSADSISGCEELLGKTEEAFRTSGDTEPEEAVRFAPEYPERPVRTAPLESEEKPTKKTEPETALSEEESAAEKLETAADGDEADDNTEASDNGKSNNTGKNGKIDLAALVKQAKALKEK